MVKNSLFRNLPQGRCDSAGGFRLRSACIALVTLLLMSVAGTANAQIVQLANESFRKALPQGWSVYPASTPTAPTWASDTHVTASGKYAMHGYVPYNAGDTVELVTPFYDCTNYKHVQLKFKHICKVLGSDLCQVMYREDNLSSQWRPIPADAYKGECKSYKNNLAFDHASYTEWKSTDTFAIPTADWYREEVFDMSDYAGYSTVAFKFVIKKGGNFGSFILDGWYLEDFQLEGSIYRMEPPFVRIQNKDSVVYHTGPFTISAEIIPFSGTPIVAAYLLYRAVSTNGTVYDSIPMKRIVGDTIWTASIPHQAVGTRVYCRVYGRDSLQLSSFDTSSFRVKPIIIGGMGNSAALVDVREPLKYALSGSQPSVQVTIMNLGTDPLKTLLVNWTVNRVLQQPFVWSSGNVQYRQGAKAYASIGSFTKSAGTDTLVIWVSLPNNMQDSVTYDDTLTYLVYACDKSFSGSYTVGIGGIYDFQSMNDAVHKMRACGVAGDVRLLVADGTYDEAWDFYIPASVVGNHRITVAPLSGKKDSVIVAPKGGSRPLSVSNSANLHFEKLAFSAFSTLGNNCAYLTSNKNLSFHQCTFIGQDVLPSNLSNSGTEYSTVIFNGTNDSIWFVGNRVQYGSYGIKTTVILNSVFDSNIVEDFQYGAAWFDHWFLGGSFSHNTIIEGDDISGTNSGVRFGNPNLVNGKRTGNLRLEGNRLQYLGGATTQYGFWFYMCDSTVVACNNELVLNSVKGSTYGFHISNDLGTRLIHNSVLIQGTSNAAQYGIYVSTDSNSRVVIRNNLSVIDSGMTAEAYPLYITDAKHITACNIDNNAWFSRSNVAYVAHGITSDNFKDYQISVPSAVHDVYACPTFSDSLRGNLRYLCRSNFSCPAMGMVPKDLEGNARQSWTARGCYRQEQDSLNTALCEVLGFSVKTYLGDTLHPAVVLQNRGRGVMTAASIRWEVNGVAQPAVSWSGKLAAGASDTVILGRYIIQGLKDNELKVYLVRDANSGTTYDDTICRSSFTCRDLFSGTYTVGDTGYFKTLEEAFATLQDCGMAGHVTLAFLPGTYHMNTVIPAIKGVDSSHVLDITSVTGDSTDVDLRMGSYSSLNSAAAPIIIQGGKYIYLHHLTLTGYVNENDSVYAHAHAIVVDGAASNVRISNCRLRLSKSLTGGSNVNYDVSGIQGGTNFASPENNNCDDYSIVYMRGGNVVNGIMVSHSLLEGGVCGFYLSGASGASVSNITMKNNFLKDIDFAACVGLYCSCDFFGNRVFQRRQNQTKAGFCVYLGNSTFRIENNIFNMMSFGTGIILNSAAVGDVVNNDIYGGNVGIFFGIRSGGNVFHNTFHVNKYGIYTTGMPSGLPPQVVLQMLGQFVTAQTAVQNNIFHVRNGYPLYTPFTAVARPINCRSNNLYDETSGRTSNNNTWIDSASISVLPIYADTSFDLRVLNRGEMLCQREPMVSTDIYNQERTVPLTCMGAHESLPACDISLDGFANTDALAVTGTHPVGVVIRNQGEIPIDSVLIILHVNGVQTASVLYRPKQPLVSNGRDTVWLGHVIVSAGFTKLLAFTHLASDTILHNDTLRLSVYSCAGKMSGSYTLFGSNPDYETAEDLLQVLYTCGVSGPVEVRIRSGKYGPLALEDTIPGSSRINTVTFVPDGGDVVFDGGVNEPGLKLKNTSHLIFKGLTFGDTVEGRIGVQLEEQCAYITIRECGIFASVTAINSAYRAINYLNPNKSIPHDIYITSNHIVGGAYNMYVSSMAGTTSSVTAASMYVDSNLLTGAASYGVWAEQYFSLRSFSYNTVCNRHSNTPYQGLYLRNLNGLIEQMVCNRINIQSDTLAYGIYVGYFLNQSLRGALIANNEIRITGENGEKRGIWIPAQYSNLEVHHNSIYVRSANGTAYAMYGDFNLNSTANFVRITRNLLVAEGKNEWPLYFSGTYLGHQYGVREYNNLYSSTYVGYALQPQSTVAGFLTATVNNDSGMMNIKPHFTDSSVSLVLESFDNLSCTKKAEVLTDINGNLRSEMTTVGCYALAMNEHFNADVYSFSVPYKAKGVSCIEQHTPVGIVVRNKGMESIPFDSSALRIQLDVTGAATFHWDTLVTNGVLLPAHADTIYLTDIPVHSSGTYHIKVTLKDSADNYPEDDTLSMDYTLSRIQPPYDVDFSAVPAELVNVRNAGTVDWQVVRDSAMPSSFGTGRLEFAGAGNPGASASAVFNAVDIQGCVNPMLSFWYAHGVNSGTRDILYVFATTDGGASYTTIGRITPTDTTTGWRQYDIDLSRFVNEPCLSIVFQAICFGGANQSLDRIRITADADASLTLLPVDASTLTACMNDAVPLKVVVSNITAMPVEYKSDTIRATVTGASNQGFTCVYSKQLGGYESDTITLGGMDLRANGSYYLNAFLQSQDDNAMNDTASDSTILIRQDISIDSIIGIDGKMSKAAGDTVNVSVLLRNGSNMAVERFTVTMELDGETVVTDTVLRRLEAGDSIVHAMSAPYIVPSGTKEQPYYFLELSASLSCDGEANNDARSLVGVIDVPDTVDLQVLSIARPATDSGRVKVSPKVTVANIGNAEVQNVMLHVDVLDSAMRQLETVSEYINFINVDDTLEYAFSLSYTVPNYDGRYYLKAYVDRYADEINTLNDTLTSQFVCRRNATGIADHVAAGWSVGQNEPNPAAGVTVIPFVVPEDAEVVLTVTNVNGQLLHREVIPAAAGPNRVTLQTGTLPSGLYYYGVEYKGQRIVRKMNVVR